MELNHSHLKVIQCKQHQGWQGTVLNGLAQQTSHGLLPSPSKPEVKTAKTQKKKKMSEDPDGTAGKTCSWHLHLDFAATSCYSTCGCKCWLWKVRGRGQTRVSLALKRLMPKLSTEYQISMKRVLSNLLTLDTYIHLLAFNPRILFLWSKTLHF